MDDDDAPQISTLKEEASPPPHALTPTTSTKLRVKLVVSKNSGTSPKSSVPLKRQRSDDGGEDDDDQEDQLIDDEDQVTPSALAPVKPMESPPATKRKAPAKRRTKKNDVNEVSSLETTYEANQVSMTVAGTESITAAPPPKKRKTAVAKAPVTPRTIKSRTPKAKTIVSQLAEDSGAISEALTGTAASSPVTLPSPEPEQNLPPKTELEVEEEKVDLSTVPVPVYALPTKPFPVQPAPKLPTGYSTAIPLERTNKSRVRRWRLANREIRGIGGGRWFARTWVGEKNSDYAGSKLAMAEAALAIPKLPALLAAKGKGKATKALSHTAGSSRSESVGADGAPPTVRNLTKMRTSMQFDVAPSSEAGDSDIVA